MISEPWVQDSLAFAGLMDIDLLFATPNYIVERMKRDRARRWCSTLEGHVVDIGSGYSPYKRFLIAAQMYTSVETEVRYRPDVVASASELPFSEESIDSLMMTEVLEHVAEPADLLTEARRVLKRGGRLYLTVPMTWCLHYAPHDYYRFTNFGITYLLDKTGFRVEAVEPMGGLFTIISARLADCCSTIFVDRPLKRLGLNKGRMRACAILLAGFNLFGFYAGRFLDRFWREDVFAWAVMARKV